MAKIVNETGGQSANRWRLVAWSAAALLLVLPYLAMQFTRQVAWDLADFAIFAAMLGSTGIACELVCRKTGDSRYRLATEIAVAGGFLLVGVNGAVGIIGDANNEANFIFGAVIAVCIVGAIIARLQPRGMARALFATAIAQVLVTVIALLIDGGDTGLIWPWNLVLLTVFFAALWLLSGWLFQNSVLKK